MVFISVLLLLCVLEVFIIQYLVHLVRSGFLNIPSCCFVLVICTIDIEYVTSSHYVSGSFLFLHNWMDNIKLIVSSILKSTYVVIYVSRLLLSLACNLLRTKVRILCFLFVTSKTTGFCFHNTQNVCPFGR